MATTRKTPAKKAAPAKRTNRARATSAEGGAAGGAAAPPPGGEVLEGATAQPDVVFIGTVLQTASSSVAEVEPAADTVVVRVDQVVSGAPAFHDHVGEPVTVALPDGVEVAEGDVHVFQAMAWIFGTGLAVRAVSVGEQAVPAATVTPPDGAFGAEERLRRRMGRADHVVSGVVRQVSHVPTAEDHPITEHDPRWQDAVVEVHGQLAQAAGAAPSEVTVRFAASRDVSWRDAPKFSVGERGVWLLGAPQPAAMMAVADELPTDHYVVVDPDDFTPAGDAPTLMAEIGEGRGEQ